MYRLDALCGRPGAGENAAALPLPCPACAGQQPACHLHQLQPHLAAAVAVAGLRSRFQAAVRRVLSCSTWGEAMALMGLRPPTPAQMTARLRACWTSSLAKGYHSKRTDFAWWAT
jgi:hypothetical protein